MNLEIRRNVFVIGTVKKNVRGTQDTAPQELTNSTVSAPPHKSIISGKSGVEVDGASKQTLIKMGSSAAVTR